MSHKVPIAQRTEERQIPAHRLGEKEMLWAFLKFARATAVAKIEGLTDEGMRSTPVKSGTCVGGIIKHLTTGEQHWVSNTLGGLDIELPFHADDPDGDWRINPGESVERLVARYRTACNLSDKIIASLSLESTGAQMSGDYTLRWVMTHLIAETNRHVGQADLLRELADGERGW